MRTLKMNVHIQRHFQLYSDTHYCTLPHCRAPLGCPGLLDSPLGPCHPENSTLQTLCQVRTMAHSHVHHSACWKKKAPNFNQTTWFYSKLHIIQATKKSRYSKEWGQKQRSETTLIPDTFIHLHLWYSINVKAYDNFLIWFQRWQHYNSSADSPDGRSLLPLLLFGYTY